MRNIALLVLAAVIAFTVPASAGPPTYYGYFESPGGGSTDGLPIPGNGLAFGHLTGALLTQSVLTDCEGVESNGLRLEVGGSLAPAFVSNSAGTAQAACGSFAASGAIVGNSFTLTDGWSWLGNSGDTCAGITDTNGYSFSSLTPAQSETVNAAGDIGLCHTLDVAGALTGHSTFDALGATTLHSTLAVTGNYTTTNGNLTTTNGNIVSTNGDLIGNFLFWSSGYGIGANSDTCAGVTASAFTIENVSASVVLTGDTSHNIGGCGNITAAGTIGGGGASGFTFTNSGGSAVANNQVYGVTTTTATPGPYAPCFGSDGTTCTGAATEHVVRGHVTGTYSGDCPTLTECVTSVATVTLSGAAVFTGTNTFTCVGNDANHNILPYCTGVSGSEFAFGFFNATNATITGGSNFDFVYTCEGH